MWEVKQGAQVGGVGGKGKLDRVYRVSKRAVRRACEQECAAATHPACAGSWPDPPPAMSATCQRAERMLWASTHKVSIFRNHNVSVHFAPSAVTSGKMRFWRAEFILASHTFSFLTVS